MGWTGSTTEGAQELIAGELRGVEVLGRSGNWVVWRNEAGHVGLTYFITERNGGASYVKPVDIGMGPNKTPPASIARKYLAYYDNDYDKAGGVCGAPVLRRSMEPKVEVSVGDRVYLAYPDCYKMPDGSGAEGWYVYLGKYRARREDGTLMALTKNWKTMIRKEDTHTV